MKTNDKNIKNNNNEYCENYFQYKSRYNQLINYCNNTLRHREKKNLSDCFRVYISLSHFSNY